METSAHTYLAREARSLLTRLERLRPFSLQMPMVPAASVSPKALSAIEEMLARGQRELRYMILSFISWIEQGDGCRKSPPEIQRRLTILRLRFNAVLTHLDIFADVLSQRGEHDTGVWMAGLDTLAADALRLEGNYYAPPPVICYLDRGAGAAIRRAKTRLPGGGENPVAVIRIPRERMIGTGIASSLVHEVGHQGAALLGLVESIRPELRKMQRCDGKFAFRYFERTISEILADFWAVAMLGVTATKGLMSVVSLPKAFVFRIAMDDPHPFPWIRVKISCAIGKRLHPHPQWDETARLWESLYPLAELPRWKREVIRDLENHLPTLARLIAEHRPLKLRRKRLGEVFPISSWSPDNVRRKFTEWKYEPRRINAERPTLVFAALGASQSNLPAVISGESSLIEAMTQRWSLQK